MRSSRIPVFLTVGVTAFFLMAGTGGGGFKKKAPPFTEIEDVEVLGINNWGFAVTNLGSHGFDLSAFNAGGEFPRGSGHYLIFAGGLLVGAVKDPAASDPDFRYSVSHFDYAGDFTPGSLLDFGVPFDQLVWDNPYTNDTRLFVIDTTRSGSDWSEWPYDDGAPLDTARTPLLVSDLDSWAVFNDADPANHESGQTPIPGIGLEVQQSSYAFTQGSLPGSENAFFLRWRIRNQTNVTYDSVYIGLFVDPDVGSATNDLIGTDTSRNMVYCYNGSDESTPTGMQYALGYKVMFFSEDGGIDADMTISTVYGNGVGSNTDPTSDSERYYYLRGLDQDGSIRLASEGLVEVDGSPFVFPGDPISGTGLLDNNPNDKRMMINVGPFTCRPGTPYDLIIVALGGEAGDRLAAVTDLRSEADNIESIFAANILQKLDINSGPNLTAALDTIDFGETSLGYPESKSVLLKNFGTDSLQITSVSTADSVYLASSANLSLPAGGRFPLMIEFLPTDTGLFNATLSIASNDPDNPVLQIPLTGRSIFAPAISVQPDSIIAFLTHPDSASSEITLHNLGAGELDWSILIDGSGVLNGSTVLFVNTLFSDFQQALEAEGAGTSAFTGEMTPEILDTIDALVVDDTFNPSPAEIATVNAWVRSGGGLMICGESGSDLPEYNNMINGSGIVFLGADPTAGITTNITEHPATRNVTSYEIAGPGATFDVSGEALDLIRDINGLPHVAAAALGSGRILTIGDRSLTNSTLTLTGHLDLGVSSAAWLSGVRWLTVDPLIGTIAPGDSAVLGVVIRSAGLPGGVHDANLNIFSNDPLLPVAPVSVRVNVDVVPAVRTNNGLIPKRFSLYQNFPNPFNPSTTIRFDLPDRSRVILEIYNLLGERVATLVDSFVGAGRHSVVWNGRNENGQTVGSGVYLVRLRAGHFAGTRKMLLLK